MEQSSDKMKKGELKEKVFFQDKEVVVTGDTINFKGHQCRILDIRALELKTDFVLRHAAIGIAIIVMASFIPWRLIGVMTGILGFVYLLLYARRTVVIAEVNQMSTGIFSTRSPSKAKKVVVALEEVIKRQDELYTGHKKRDL
jgi:hypothetical protein